jgi:hypothetical protein
MDQRSITLYLKRNGGIARVLHDDLVVMLCEEAIAYSIVTKYLPEVHAGPEDAPAVSERIGRAQINGQEDQ